MMLTATPLYAGLLALLYVMLSARVILYRRANGISLGDKGDPALLQLIRAQANCGEYAVIGLLLLLIADLQGAPAVALHVLGLALLAGRVAHAAGLWSHPQRTGLRVAGMALTLNMIGFTAIGLVLHALF